MNRGNVSYHPTSEQVMEKSNNERVLVAESDDALSRSIVSLLSDGRYEVSTNCGEGMKSVLGFIGCCRCGFSDLLSPHSATEYSRLRNYYDTIEWSADGRKIDGPCASIDNRTRVANRVHVPTRTRKSDANGHSLYVSGSPSRSLA